MGIKFIIFAHARSGSSSLVDALNAHPKITVMTEPFDENRINWDNESKIYKLELNKIPKKVY
jgi:hypothetical protein|tara:strand:+ start:181 stop:366 length:186 start_codon:yes stop_codon:yes gene_type:complete